MFIESLSICPTGSRINRGLIQRKYSPLTAAVVDASMGKHIPRPPASIIDQRVLKGLAGRCGEDAVLALRISKWDESSLLSHNQVRFTATVTLLGGPEGTVLLAGGLDGAVKAGGLGPAPRQPEERARAAVEEFVRKLMEVLPWRRP